MKRILLFVCVLASLAINAQDICTSAVALSCGGSISATTAGASDNNPATCSSAGDGNSGGMWYSFTGNGNEITVTVNADPGTADDLNDSQLAVYRGSCGSLVCETGNDDNTPPSSNGSQVTFTTISGTDYYFYVDGYNTNSGAFEISMTCGAAPPPSNDDCANATAIGCGATNVRGTTIAANNNGTSCGGAADGTGGGVWYSFAGVGTDVTVTVNADPGTGSDLGDSQLAVYSGACGGLTCVGGNDDNSPPGGAGSQFTFSSVVGTTYYFYVDGFGSNSGVFEISVSCVAPSNDDCANATAIGCGATNVRGTTIAASNNGTSCGGAADGTGGGVWYSFVGVGADVTVTVNADPSSGNDIGDSQLAVYSGACGGLTCVGGNDDNDPPGGNGSQYTFSSVAGTTYYFYVDGYNTNSGIFEISVSCAAPANDACANAIDVMNGSSVVGSNASATNVESLTSCSGGGGEPTATTCDAGSGTNDFGSGVWYKYTSTTSEAITASVDNGTTNFDTEIQVFQGNCGGLTCIGGDDDGGSGTKSTFCWRSTATTAAPVEYYIYVDGHGSNNGLFELNISTDAIVPVELVTFEGEAMTKHNKLEWMTATEENAEKFIIERSTTGAGDWKQIGRVAATGYSSTSVDYKFMDEQPFSMAYYRLRMVDFDGSTEYSNIVQIKRDDQAGSIRVYPVPAKNYITLTVDAVDASSTQVFITDISGRLVKQQSLELTSGVQEITVDINNFPAGMYYLRLDLNGTQQVQRIVKE